MGDSLRTQDPRFSRRDLERVIRRALELGSREGDVEVDERLSADEVLRIGAELGLSEQHVRQALHELPIAADAPDGVLEKWLRAHFGAPLATSSRVISGDAERLRGDLEDYLVAKELLRVRRRQGPRVLLEPADDALSAITRAISRLSGPRRLRVADSIGVSALALDERSAHVQVVLDLNRIRSGAIRTGAIVGGILGALASVASFFAIAVPLVAVVGLQPVAAVPLGGAAALATIAAGVRAGLGIAGRRFRRSTEDASTEVEGLLDRLEHGGRLGASPGPWKRRLRTHLAGPLLPPA